MTSSRFESHGRAHASDASARGGSAHPDMTAGPGGQPATNLAAPEAASPANSAASLDASAAPLSRAPSTSGASHATQGLSEADLASQQSSPAEPAERLQTIAASRILAVFDRASDIEVNGSRAIRPELGWPDSDTPQVVKDAAAEALSAGRVHYGPNAGVPRLLEEIAAMLSTSSQFSYDPHREVLVTIEASEAVLLAIMAFCNPGDEVIIPVPAWPAYEACVRLAHATPVHLPLRPGDDYVLDPREVQRLLTPARA